MKKGLLAVALLILPAAGLRAGDEKAAPVTAELKWVTDNVFEVPESAVYDSVRDVIYVSNINGVPRQADYNGYISKVKTDGSIEQLKWIGSLNAPQGDGDRRRQALCGRPQSPRRDRPSQGAGGQRGRSEGYLS